MHVRAFRWLLSLLCLSMSSFLVYFFFFLFRLFSIFGQCQLVVRRGRASLDSVSDYVSRTDVVFKGLRQQESTERVSACHHILWLVLWNACLDLNGCFAGQCRFVGRKNCHVQVSFECDSLLRWPECCCRQLMPSNGRCLFSTLAHYDGPFSRTMTRGCRVKCLAASLGRGHSSVRTVIGLSLHHYVCAIRCQKKVTQKMSNRKPSTGEKNRKC